MEIYGGAAGIIASITAVLKTMLPEGWERITSLLPLVVGIVVALLMPSIGGAIQEQVLAGIALGLGTSGTYNTVKRVGKSRKKK